MIGIREYQRPATVEQALTLMVQYGTRAKIISGGTDLLVSIKKGKITPETLIDISNLVSLKKIIIERDLIRLGAAVTFSQLLNNPLINNSLPVLVEAAAQTGSPLIRNIGTIGGNLATASPAADCVIALCALGARLVIKSLNGQRELNVEDFMAGPGITALSDGELITEILIPIPNGNEGGSFIKLGKRNALAIAVVNVAVWLKTGSDPHHCTDARIAIGSVAPTVFRASRSEDILKEQPLDDSIISRAAQAVGVDVRPIDDIRASAGYRRKMSESLVRRALEKVISKISS